MSKRFGRNQRRKMREQVLKLERDSEVMELNLRMNTNQLRMEHETLRQLKTRLGCLARLSMCQVSGSVRAITELNGERFGFAIDRRDIEAGLISKDEFISDTARALAYAMADRLFQDKDLNRLFKPWLT